MMRRIMARPLSTLSAVRTPVSVSPSSTRVIATAGRIPTTTVTASSTRDNVVEHPTDKGIDDLQRGDVDHHPARTAADDADRQIVLQRQCELVVHVDLDRDQQTIADLQNGDFAHAGYSAFDLG